MSDDLMQTFGVFTHCKNVMIFSVPMPKFGPQFIFLFSLYLVSTFHFEIIKVHLITHNQKLV